jgi:hypothetical protein
MRRRRFDARLAVIPLVAVVALAATVGSHCDQPSEVVVVDAAIDANRRADAGLDGPSSEGSDAIADSDGSGSILSDWPGWKRVADLQNIGCPLDVAADPSTVVPAIKWIPCQDGRPSCQEIDSSAFSSSIIKFPDGQFSRDGRAFLLSHWIKFQTLIQIDVFDAKNLSPLAAWRIDWTNAPQVYCNVQPAFSDTQMGVLYFTALNGADGGPIHRSIDIDTPTGLMANPRLAGLETRPAPLPYQTPHLHLIWLKEPLLSAAPRVQRRQL